MAYGNLITNFDNVELPREIKCNRCHKAKGHHCFAKTRLADLKKEVAGDPSKGGPTSEVIPCCLCTGIQQVEFACKYCDRVLPRKFFAKNQLRGGKSDEATCNKCMAARLDDDPDDKDSDSDSGSGGDSDGSDDSDDTYGGGTVAASIGLGSLSISGTGTDKDSTLNSTSGSSSSRGGAPVGSYTNGTNSITGFTPAGRAPAVSITASTATRRTTSPTHKATPPHLRNKAVVPVPSSTPSAFATESSSEFAKIKGQRTFHYGDTIAREARWGAEADARRTATDGPDGVTVACSDDDSDSG